jgi:tetratricopeptide (TPR) repeat protein
MAKQRRKFAPPAKSKSSKSTAKPVASGRRVTPKAQPARRSSRAANVVPERSTRQVRVTGARPKARTVVKRATKAPTKADVRPAMPARPGTPGTPPQPPVRRSTYAEAVALYQRGVEALQAHRFRDAEELLQSVIARFPDEKELHERAFLYLRVCERQIAATPSRPETHEERTFAATLAINNGSPDHAIAILSTVIAEDPENDQATYMLGVANALKGRTDIALLHLSRAMALNPENRDIARKDPDLEALRRTDDMRQLIASPPTPLPRKAKRIPTRGRGR